MQKKRAAWFCLHTSLLLAERSRHTVYTRTVTQCVSGSCLLWGGCRQFTKGLNNAQSGSAWLGVGKWNSNSKERDKEKKIWSSDSSKLLSVWYWAVKWPLQINLLAAVFPAFCHQQLRSSPPPWALLLLWPFAQSCQHADIWYWQQVNGGLLS